MKTDNTYHTPLFAEEILSWCAAHSYTTAIDATCGEGGHTSKLLQEGFRVYAIDYDERILAEAQKRIGKNKNITWMHGNFSDIVQLLEKLQDSIDVILFDFGISMWHYKASGRGFSIEKLDEPLDMRSNTHAQHTAEHILRHMSVVQLQQALEREAEIRNSKMLATKMYIASREGTLKTVGDLVEICGEDSRQVMQVLRVMVNSEREALALGLKGAVTMVQKGGSLITITFHSLEDRDVKLQMKKNKAYKLQKLLIQKSLPFAKSAKLRIYERVN